MNESLSSIEENSRLQVARKIIYAVYWIVGMFIISFNGLLAFVILRYKKLRCESNNRPLVAGLAISDFILGVAYVSTAVAYFFDNTMDNVPPLACMKFVHVVFWWWGPILMPLFLAVVSLDRLICVLAPLKYVQLGRLYILVQVSVPVITSVLLYSIGWVLAISAHESFTDGENIICYRELIVSNDIYIYIFDTVQVLVPLFAVLAYLLVMVIFMVSPKSQFDNVAKDQRERENRITKTLGIMALSTCCFYTIPSLSQSVVHYVPSLNTIQNTYLLAVANDVAATLEALHSLANCAIYAWRADDVRMKMTEFKDSGLRKLLSFCRSHKPKENNSQNENNKLPKSSTPRRSISIKLAVINESSPVPWNKQRNCIIPIAD